MRCLVAWFLPILFFIPFLNAQMAPAPQSARQALIEMFFGTAPNHLERHLSDSTRNVLRKMNGPNGVNIIDQFSSFAMMAKAGGGKFETYETGPTLLVAEDPHDSTKVEITVEGDNLSGDEDQIEVALRVTKDEKEQVLPFIPRFMFTMKAESDVWRLSEITATIRVPLEDPDFLKNIREQHNKENEQQAEWGIRSIINAEDSYHSVHGTYACKLSDLAAKPKEGSGFSGGGLVGDLGNGRYGGYIFVISGCDGTQYKVVGEPEVPDSGERAFCSDESGMIRFASDGKATSCLSAGEPVLERSVTRLVAPQADVAAGVHPQVSTEKPEHSKPQRIRVSQGVSQNMLLSKVAPVYPPEARAAKVQGAVVMTALIDKDGTIQSLEVVSGDPLLVSAATNAVKQWKYRPYLLNGNPVEVETQIRVNFTLAH